MDRGILWNKSVFNRRTRAQRNPDPFPDKSKRGWVIPTRNGPPTATTRDWDVFIFFLLCNGCHPSLGGVLSASKWMRQIRRRHEANVNEHGWPSSGPTDKRTALKVALQTKIAAEVSELLELATTECEGVSDVSYNNSGVLVFVLVGRSLPSRCRSSSCFCGEPLPACQPVVVLLHTHTHSLTHKSQKPQIYVSHKERLNDGEE